jgi:hypothetical protein
MAVNKAQAEMDIIKIIKKTVKWSSKKVVGIIHTLMVPSLFHSCTFFCDRPWRPIGL